MLPRRFALVRHVDYTGVSGVGVVAYGVTFADGHVVLRWCSTHPATSMWSSVDDLLAIHGHGEATSIEWIDAPHGDLEEIAVSSSRRRRARRRAERETAPAPGETGTGDIPATRTTDPAGIPVAVPTAADQSAEADAARDDDPTVTSDPVRSVTDSVTDRTGSLHEAHPIRATQDAERVPAVDDTHTVPGPASKPARELEPAPEARTGSAGRESTTEAEEPSPQSTPGASPDRTDELTATQAWPAWADVADSEPVARPAASLPERPAIRDVRQENPRSGPEAGRRAERRLVQRMEPTSREDPESTDPFASVLAEEPPDFPERSNGHRHIDTITGLLDLPADLAYNSRAADSRTAAESGSGPRSAGPRSAGPRSADSRSEPAPAQLRRAGRHRRDDD